MPDLNNDFNLDEWLEQLNNELGDDFSENLSDNIFDWTDTSQGLTDDVNEVWTLDSYMLQADGQMNAILAYMLDWMSADSPPEFWAGGNINYSGFEASEDYVGGQIGTLELADYDGQWPPSAADFAASIDLAI